VPPLERAGDHQVACFNPVPDAAGGNPAGDRQKEGVHDGR
jgi:hypothetical protein